MTVADQLSHLQKAKRAVSGLVKTPKRGDPYLDVDLLSLQGRLYWRSDRNVYELVADNGERSVFRTPELLLRHCCVSGRKATSD